MKIHQPLLGQISERVRPLDTQERRAMYLAGKFPNAAIVQDLNMRYRWDLFYGSKAYQVLPAEHDYNDDHIDTALRRIVPALATE